MEQEVSLTGYYLTIEQKGETDTSFPSLLTPFDHNPQALVWGWYHTSEFHTLHRSARETVAVCHVASSGPSTIYLATVDRAGCDAGLAPLHYHRRLRLRQ